MNPLTESLVKLYQDNKAKVWEQSPDLLNDFREEAMARFTQLGVPSFKDEDYKYTRIDKAINPSLMLAGMTVSPTFSIPSFPSQEAFQLNFCNGAHCKSNFRQDFPENVVVGPVSQMALEHPEIFTQYYNKQAAQSNDAFVALNTALTHDGLLVYVPDGVEVELPIQVADGMNGVDAQVVSLRNLVVLGKGAKATLLFVEHNINNANSLMNQVSEFVVGEGAELHVNIVQDLLSESVMVDAQFYQLEEGAKAHQTVVSLNAGTIRNNLHTDLVGEGAEMTINGMSVLDAKQHVDNFTQITHAVPNCLSNQLYKNVLDGEAVGAFAGRIHVVRNAQKTNAFQRNNNVLLSKTAKMHAKPQLIIDADDVKCSHGATVGQIDEEALFYMQARGIGKQQARMMLMNAFCHEVISEIKNEFIRDVVAELVESKLSKE